MTQSKNNIKLNWYGWMNPWSGYGKANLEWSTALNRATNNGVYLGWERRTKESDIAVWNDLTQEQRDFILKPNRKCRIGIIKSTPDLFRNNKSNYRIGFTMCENTLISKRWANWCNEMDHIFVPNPQNKEAFINSGVTVPIDVVRQGFNPEQYQYFDRPNRDVFTFTLAGWLDERKNWQDVVRAFTSEFKKKEPVRLILKNSCPTFGYRQPIDERIKIVDKIYSPQDMIKLYQITDCFLFTTRGEGSGLPAREAMATGLPIIVTNYQGLAEVSNSKYNYPIDPISIDYPDTREDQPGFMARLDVSEIMYWMRYIYEHQEEAREKGKLASEWMHKEWKWDDCAKDMLEIIKKIKCKK